MTVKQKLIEMIDDNQFNIDKNIINDPWRSYGTITFFYEEEAIFVAKLDKLYIESNNPLDHLYKVTIIKNCLESTISNDDLESVIWSHVNEPIREKLYQALPKKERVIIELCNMLSEN